jgi:hypothetical protein
MPETIAGYENRDPLSAEESSLLTRRPPRFYRWFPLPNRSNWTQDALVLILIRPIPVIAPAQSLQIL